jgi:phytoene dehydrogenase-like protein
MSNATRRYDALLFGGGHNGLVCACYLAAAGLSVAVFERRSIVGGAAVTEEFHPGFRNSTASYTVSLLHPKVSADLRLAAHGLEIVERPVANFLPLSEGDAIAVGGDLAATQAEVARFSPKDAEALPAYYAMLGRVADVLRALLLQTPPNVGGGIQDILQAWKVGGRLKRLGISERRDLLDLFTKSAGEILDHWFESEPIKAAFGFDSVVGNFASPYTPGSAYVLLHHVFGEVNGKRGQWGHAVGGMGAITQAMAKEALARGVELFTDAPVACVITHGFGQEARANGIALADGSVIGGRAIIANVNPKLLYLQLVDADALDADFRRRIEAYRCASATFRMNVALDRAPDFRCRPGDGPHLKSGIIIAPSLAYMERAYFDARQTGWSREPIIEMLIPSLVDTTLAPAGKHVASLFCQHANPMLPGGASWDDVKTEVEALMIATIDRHAPNFAESVIARRSYSPLDLEREFGMIGGDIFHGALALDQLFSARPVLGHGNYRAPIRGLYMCGAGTHPGGGVTGIPGHNAAREILHDARRKIF